MRKLFVGIIAFLVSRRTLWRLGRALYLKARADVVNEMEINGEKKVQCCVLKNLVNEDEKIVFFDVGANVGDWTLSTLDQAARLGVEKQLEIHSFEPVLSTFQTLQRRINEVHGSNKAIYLINQAMSSTDGSADIFIVGENAGTNSLYPDPMHPGTHSLRIELTSGDNYCALKTIDKVHFLKCDVEGHDMDVLCGVKNLIESGRVMVFQFEYTHFWVYSRHYLKDVFDFISGYQYKIGKITPDKIEIYEKWHPELEKFFAGNYLIIHESALQWFDLTKGSFDVSDTYGI